jgi:hypothetical protein
MNIPISLREMPTPGINVPLNNYIFPITKNFKVLEDFTNHQKCKTFKL